MLPLVSGDLTARPYMLMLSFLQTTHRRLIRGKDTIQHHELLSALNHFLEKSAAALGIQSVEFVRGLSVAVGAE